MTEPFLLILFKVVWQNLEKNIAYSSMKKSWQLLQFIIEESNNNEEFNQDLAMALEKCFYLSKKNIAEKCREELIKNSKVTQYRGAKIYKPPENDRDIINLENQIKLWDKQLKKINKNSLEIQSVISTNKMEELLKQLSKTNYDYDDEKKDVNIDNKLFQEAEKDCNVKIYKNALRDKENGLNKNIFDRFIAEIERNTQLNRIFDVKAYLT